jgi:hypothetical protein
MFNSRFPAFLHTHVRASKNTPGGLGPSPTTEIERDRVSRTVLTAFSARPKTLYIRSLEAIETVDSESGHSRAHTHMFLGSQQRV